MAQFAELDKDNKVLRVVAVDDSHVSADMAIDGETWCANNIVEDPAIAYVDGAYTGVAWKQCSYNTYRGSHKNSGEGKTPLRANYPAIGDIWNEENQIFVLTNKTTIYTMFKIYSFWFEKNWRFNGIALLCSCLLWLDLYFGLRQDLRRLEATERL